MINIHFFEDDNKNQLGFTADGHAGSVQKGEDLVCAAASALAQTLEGYAELLTRAEEAIPAPPEIEMEDGHAKIILTLSPEGYLLGRIAFHVVRVGFNRLEAAYPSFVRVMTEVRQSE